MLRIAVLLAAIVVAFLLALAINNHMDMRAALANNMVTYSISDDPNWKWTEEGKKALLRD